MTLVWSSSHNPIDWLIWLFTGQDCGHFAIVFSVNGQRVVFESNLLGTHMVFYDTWMKSWGRTIRHETHVELSPSDTEALWLTWVQNYDGKMYDFTGALYTGLMLLRQRVFGIPRPSNNPWSFRDAFYCDEIYQLVSGKAGFPTITERSNGMDTPHDVWTKIGEANASGANTK